MDSLEKFTKMGYKNSKGSSFCEETYKSKRRAGEGRITGKEKTSAALAVQYWYKLHHNILIKEAN